MTDELWAKWNGLQNAVRISQRYHERREAYFARLGRLAQGFSLIAGSATIGVALKADPLAALISGSIVTVLSTANMVIGASDLARRHMDLRRAFFELEARMVVQQADGVDGEIVDRFVADRLRIEATEPPVMNNLIRLCHNQVCISLGLDGQRIRVGRWARLTANLLSGPDRVNG